MSQWKNLCEYAFQETNLNLDLKYLIANYLCFSNKTAIEPAVHSKWIEWLTKQLSDREARQLLYKFQNTPFQIGTSDIELFSWYWKMNEPPKVVQEECCFSRLFLNATWGWVWPQVQEPFRCGTRPS